MTATKKLTTTVAEQKIFITSDYGLFHFIPGNRPVNVHHVRNIVKRMKKKVLFTPLAVDKDLGVIDGQHRFCARESLGLPIPYYIVEDYTLAEVQELNAMQKKWSAEDYMNSNIELGHKDYEIFKWFREKYGFGHPESVQMLTGEFRNRDIIRSFNIGLFRIKNLSAAQKMAEDIIRIEAFYKNIRRRPFVRAMVFLFAKQNFELDVLLKKLALQPTVLKDCANTEQYINLLEEIYNYKSQKKVSLRYGD